MPFLEAILEQRKHLNSPFFLFYQSSKLKFCPTAKIFRKILIIMAFISTSKEAILCFLNCIFLNNLSYLEKVCYINKLSFSNI
jgi:hypothetical protein